MSCSFTAGKYPSRNVLSGHYRLLDAGNWRHAWGTFDDCRSTLAQIRVSQRLPAMSGSGILLLHGLVRSAAHVAPLARYLRAHTNQTVFNVTYPTTRGSIDDHAEQLNRVIKSLEGVGQLSLVGHSLGTLVIRRYLADASEQERARIGRIVMLGPPNQAAKMAEMLGHQRWFGLVLGKAATQLRSVGEVGHRLAIPSSPFGIIAGGRGGPRGYNPLLAGDNDFLVDVASTRLAGAADFAVLPVSHAFMMANPLVQQYDAPLLETGAFTLPEPRATDSGNRLRRLSAA